MTDTSPAAPARGPRILVVCLLLGLLVAVIVLVASSDRAVDLLRDPQAVGAPFRHWVQARPVLAPVIFILVYCGVALLMLPLWWLQVLAGVGFGIGMGLTWALLAATLSAAAGTSLSRWVGRDWLHRLVESRLPRLRALEEKLGHNGLLVVIAVRLIRGIPFGATNYAIGLTRITLADVVVGTLLGAAPGITVYVALGHAPTLIADVRFIAAIAAMVLVLLIPLGVRYLRPHWFKRIGIE